MRLTHSGDERPRTHNPPRPMIPTFFPGPAPFLTKGEKTVKPPHSLQGVSSKSHSLYLCNTTQSESKPWPHSHGSSLFGLEFVWNGKDESLLSTDVSGVTTLVLCTIGPEGVVAVNGIGTVLLWRSASFQGVQKRLSHTMIVGWQAADSDVSGNT
jgi:hypothetical protein